MPSLRSRLVRRWVRFSLKPLLRGGTPLAKIRRRTDGMSRLARIPRSVAREGVRIGSIEAEWLTPRDRPIAGTLLYLHGGGYCFGSIAMYRDLAARLALACSARVLVPEYRLAPEHPFPSAVDDARRVYEWLRSQDPEAPLVVAGDSAGGGLALALTVALRDAAVPLPAALVCLSPWSDLACTGESLETCAALDPMLPPDGLRLCAERYSEGHDRLNPLISPLYADFRGFPPLLIQVGTDEVLLHDSTRLAERARAAGVDVTLHVRERMWHVWHLFATAVPEARTAIAEIGEFVQQHFG